MVCICWELIIIGDVGVLVVRQHILFPEEAKKAIVDTNKQIIKTKSVQNQIIQAISNTIQQNIKTWNSNADAFTDLNRDILRSWISTFTQTKN